MLIKMKKKLIPAIMFILTVAAMVLFEIFKLSISSIYLILLGGIVGIICSLLSNKKDIENEKKEEEAK